VSSTADLERAETILDNVAVGVLNFLRQESAGGAHARAGADIRAARDAVGRIETRVRARLKPEAIAYSATIRDQVRAGRDGIISTAVNAGLDGSGLNNAEVTDASQTRRAQRLLAKAVRRAVVAAARPAIEDICSGARYVVAEAVNHEFRASPALGENAFFAHIHNRLVAATTRDSGLIIPRAEPGEPASGTGPMTCLVLAMLYAYATGAISALTLAVAVGVYFIACPSGNANTRFDEEWRRQETTAALDRSVAALEPAALAARLNGWVDLAFTPANSSLGALEALVHDANEL
jgi:hypothetical protein